LNPVSSLLYNPPHLHNITPFFNIKRAILYNNGPEVEVFPQATKTFRRETFSDKFHKNGAE
jgi:hypothetical protein